MVVRQNYLAAEHAGASSIASDRLFAEPLQVARSG